MRYTFEIDNLISETGFETEELIQPLRLNVLDFSIEPDTLEIVCDPDLEGLKPYNASVVSYLTNKVASFCVLAWDEIYVEVEDADIFNVGDVIWCEEEPMTITYKVTSYKYNVTRPQARTHVYLDGLITKSYPNSVVGCKGKIRSLDGQVVKYFVVDSLTTTGAGAVLEVSDVLKFFDNEFPIAPLKQSNILSFRGDIFDGSGLSSFMARPPRDIYLLGNDWDITPDFVSQNPFQTLLKLVQLEGLILAFSSSLYRFYKAQNLSVFDSIENIALDDIIDFGGGYQFQQLVGGTKIKTEIESFELESRYKIVSGTTIPISMTFGGLGNGREAIEPDLKGVIASISGAFELFDKAKIVNYFRSKLSSGVGALKNLIYGTLTITTSPNTFLQVGKLYNITDKEKFKMFLNRSTPITLFCVSSVEGEQTFLVIRADQQWSPIAPVLPMYWDGTKFELTDYSRLGDTGRVSDYIETDGAGLQVANIPATSTMYFASGDYIKVRKMTPGAYIERVIDTVLNDEITVKDATGLTIGYYLIGFTDTANRNSKQAKFLDIEGGTYV